MLWNSLNNQDSSGILNSALSALTSMSTGILIVSSTDRVEFINQSFCDIFRIHEKPEELVGISNSALAQMAKDVIGDTESYFSRINEIIQAGKPVSGEEVLIQNNRFLLRDYVPLYSNDQLYGRLWNYQDITERKHKELKVLESEDKYFKAFHFSPVPMIITTLQEGRFIDYNGAFLSLTGYSWDELKGRTSIEIGLWNNLEERNELLKRVKKDGRLRNALVHLRMKNGTVFRVSLSVEICIVKDVISLLGVAEDVTTKLSDEEKLRQSEEKYRLLTENITDVIWVLNVGFKRFTYISPSVYKLRGYTQEEALAQSLEETLDPGSLEAVRNHFEERMREFMIDPENHGVFIDRMRQICKDGSKIWIETSTHFQYNSRGEIEVIGVSRDITARVRHEEEIEAKELRFRMIVENSMNPIMIADDQGGYFIVNQAASELTGYSVDELLQMNVRDLKTLAPRGSDRQYKEFISKGKDAGEFEFYTKDGQLRCVDYHAVHVSDNFNLSILVDITKRKEMENQLKSMNEDLMGVVNEKVRELTNKDRLIQEQAKLAAMGEMLSNIAHQWRQPLTALGLLLQKLCNPVENTVPDLLYLKKNEEKGVHLIQHMSQTITDFQNFFKPDRESRKFSINTCLKSTLSIIDAAYKDNNIELLTDFGDELDTVGFPNEFAQVILNILSNAKDAFKTVTVKNPTVVISLHRMERGALIRIHDNAGGIPESIMGKIFDPYFTTKPTGTGIGLYMSKLIIENHMNGKISAANLDDGAEFTIEIQLA